MNIKHSLKISSAALAAFLLAGCTAAPPADGAAADAVQPPPPAAVTFTDVLDHEVTLERWDRVVSLYGSFAETWLLAGGILGRAEAVRRAARLASAVNSDLSNNRYRAQPTTL